MLDNSRRRLIVLQIAQRLGGLSATSTLLESTAIALSFGLDLFAIRVAPSRTFDVLSETFNKVQLLLTMAGLLAGIMFAKPIVSYHTAYCPARTCN